MTASPPPAPSDPDSDATHRAGFIALAGCPNVGKSTLLNELLGESIAVATGMPQTTRKTIRGVLTRPDAQIIFLDTPGFHPGRDGLNRAMVQTAQKALQDADVVALVVNASRPPGDGDRDVAARCVAAKRPTILVLNQWDRLPPGDRGAAVREARLRAYGELGTFISVHPTCALDSASVAVLIPPMARALPLSPNLYPADELTDQTPRDLVCERVREQVILLCREEVPHAVAVQVERYDEAASAKNGGADKVWAVIYVERESQKGILVGRGGERIKAIGSTARRVVGQILGHPVHLKLHVKVHANWRKDGEFLREIGLRV